MDFKYALIYLVVELYCAAQTIIIYTKCSEYLGSRLEVDLFKKMLLMFWFFLTLETIWVLGVSGMIAMPLKIASTCKVLSSLFIPIKIYYWMHFAFRRLKIKWIANPHMGIITFIPCIILFIGYIISFKNGLVFSILPDGTIKVGPGVGLIALVNNLYGIVIMVGAASVFFKTKDSLMKWKSAKHFIFIAICTAGGILDAILQNTPIMPMMITLSLVGLFSSLQEGQITTDYLTEMNNRREATRYIEEAIHRTSEELPLWLLMIEITANNTEIEKKNANEEEVIVKAAKIISDVAYLYDAFSSRWSDNVFVMVSQGMTEERLNDFEEGMLWRLKWELFEKSDWMNASVSSSKLKCEDTDTSLTELMDTLKVSLEVK